MPKELVAIVKQLEDKTRNFLQTEGNDPQELDRSDVRISVDYDEQLRDALPTKVTDFISSLYRGRIVTVRGIQVNFSRWQIFNLTAGHPFRNKVCGIDIQTIPTDKPENIEVERDFAGVTLPSHKLVLSATTGILLAQTPQSHTFDLPWSPEFRYNVAGYRVKDWLAKEFTQNPGAWNTQPSKGDVNPYVITALVTHMFEPPSLRRAKANIAKSFGD